MSVSRSLQAEAARKLLRRRAIRRDFGLWCEHALAPFNQVPAAHHRLLTRKLQAVADGTTKRLLVCMPPGSAKSTYVSQLFAPWFLAQRPRLDVIGASHTATLAESFSKRIHGFVRDHAATLGYGLATEGAEMWRTTTGGQYRAVGVGGPIAGTRADCALIDDPTKSRADADSETMRDKVWSWFLADLRTRLKPDAPIVLVNTRWHEDDLGGRLLQTQGGDWDVCKLPAIAQENDPLGRQPGEWLWNDDAYGYGAELCRVRGEYEASGAMRDWQALYQQDPRPGEGALFKTAQISIADATPPLRNSVRAWDLAATEQVGARDPDWTVGVLMHRTQDGRFVVSDVTRLRGGPDEIEAAIVATASRDGRSVMVNLPQDPGQAGKGQVLYLTRKLAGYRVESSPETGDKATRAAPYASQVNVGNVTLLRGAWNKPYLDELAGFPSATKDDQVDASSRAFNALIAPPEPAKMVRLPIMGR
jgi:predicted phage terminase large subunit-like protein